MSTDHDTNSRTIKVTEVIFRDDLYPRIETSAVTVQKYAEDLDVLPPIEVNQHNELIDGWHRWTAHKKAKAEEIKAIVTQTKSEAEFLELAIERNAAHGLQLSINDKESMAIKIWLGTPKDQQSATEERLCKILSVGPKQVSRFLSRAKKEGKESDKKTAFAMWLACHTQDGIAEKIGVPQKTVDDWIKTFSDYGQMSDSAKTLASHTDEKFEKPIYNIWKQQTKSEGSSHFGNSETRWVDNLLYLYTEPFDIVVDPFAGGGSTIDVCKKRFRRYYVSDRKPIVEREKEIRVHDLTDGLPKPPSWKDVKLVYLDPPYWKQAEGQYSDDPTDLANMRLDDFNKSLSGIINDFGKKLSNAYIAMIIQPTQWKSPDRGFTDHVGDMLRMVKLPVEMRFSVPYESQQCNAQMVEWAKENKRCLVLTREIIVWRVQK